MKIIANLLDILLDSGYRYFTEREVRSALEKQFPKKPINNGIGGYICPHCKGAILDLSHELYHRDCGGRLE